MKYNEEERQDVCHFQIIRLSVIKCSAQVRLKLTKTRCSTWMQPTNSDDGVAQAGHVEGSLTEVVRVDGVDALLGPVQTDGQVGNVDGQEDFLPGRVVEIVSNGDAFLQPQHPRVNLQSALLQPQSEESLALALSYPQGSVRERRPEPQLQLVSLLPGGQHADVGVALEGERGLDMTGLPGEAGAAAAVGPVVGLSYEPGGAGASIETLHLLAPSQGDGAVLPAEVSVTDTLVVSNQISAPSRVLTRLVSLALVYLDLAVLPLVAGLTEAGVGGDAVLAGGSVEAGRTLAVVNVVTAVRA